MHGARSADSRPWPRVHTHGAELWKSDGTVAGTALVADIRPGSYSSNPQGLINANGTLFFAAPDAASGVQLWESDGTAAGTVQLSSGSIGVDNLTNVAGIVFFTARDVSHSPATYELWESDGTVAGTTMVANLPGTVFAPPRYLTNVNGTLFFQANDVAHGTELWKSDGTAAGTNLLADINPGSASSGLRHFLAVGSSLFFTASDGMHGEELWKSDGTAAGTVMVADINPGSAASYPGGLINFKGTVFFSANDGTHGRELWKSDGTSAGTVLVQDINPGSAASSPGYLTNVNGTLFFQATDGTHGPALWKSDGTAAGTVMVMKTFHQPNIAGSAPLSPNGLTNIGGVLFFAADDGTHGIELWTSDGTTAGTALVQDINKIPQNNGRYNFYPPTATVSVNNSLFFSFNDAVHGNQLWKSDGTPAGTSMVVPTASAASAGSGPSYLTNVNGTLFYEATDPSGVGAEALWKSDGTASGTVRVVRLPSSIYGMTNVNGTLFFAANDGTHGRELWESDGTASGTVLVDDIVPGSSGSFPSNLTNINGTLFFSARDAALASQLWKSDGTASGTVQLSSGSLNTDNLTNVDGTVFFTAGDSSHSPATFELWKSDGTVGGTVLLANLAGTFNYRPQYLTNVNGTLFFQAWDAVHGQELWKSDGTAAGTGVVADINPGSASSSPRHFLAVGNTLFFTAFDSVHGGELWKSDGTAAGTVLVDDIVPGSGSSSVGNLTAVNGMVFFAANDGTHGPELWESDGTAAGTVMVADIVPGSVGSYPNNLTNVNGTLLFSIREAAHGIEIWSLAVPNSAPIASAGGPYTATEGSSLQLDASSSTDADGDPLSYSWTINGHANAAAGVKPTLTWAQLQALGIDDGAGSFSIQVTVDDGAGNVVTSSAAALSVTDPPVMATGGFTVNASENLDSGSQTVATFTDPGGAEALADYSATIDWGDTTTSAGTISYNSTTGVFTVTGAHKYAEEGSDPIMVAISHDTATPASANATASVIDQAVAATGGFAVSATEGLTSTSQTVATFTDPAGAEAIGDYSATIDWGDSSTSAGMIAYDSGSGAFTVTGAHKYAEEGSPAITVTINHDSAMPATVTDSAAVSDQAVAATGGFTLTATEGTGTGAQTVATFTDPAGAEAIGDYSATIAWGDTSTSAGAISYDSGSGVFTVQGSHTYANDGTNSITVTIHHDTATPDASASSTANVADGGTVVQQVKPLWPFGFAQINGTEYFAARNSDGSGNDSLWKTDGTAAGTVLVADISGGHFNAGVGNGLVPVNNTLFFSGSDGVHGYELWKSDGTTGGTVMVADINPGGAGSYPGWMATFNGTLFFTANDGTHGTELWKSDGTAAGTVLVMDINPGPADSVTQELTNINGTLYFTANDGSHGQELWKSDGTTAGTVLLDINPGAHGSYPGHFTNVNGTLFFEANPAGRPMLAKTDGTVAGTVYIDEANVYSPNDLVNFNGTLFFAAQDTSHGAELWMTDGTDTGTVLVKDIYPGTSSSAPRYLTVINGRLFFTARDGTHGFEPWTSDGTTAGTVLLKDINPGSSGSYAGRFGPYFTNVNGKIFFAANDGTHGYELWQTDGTSGGTTLVQDINPGSGSAYPMFGDAINGTLFFGARINFTTTLLWDVSVGESIPVSAGGPYSVTEGQSLALNAPASSDDNDTLTYSWTVNGHAAAATGLAPTLTWTQLQALGVDDGPGTFAVQLTVDDGHGNTAMSAPVTLTIIDPPVAATGGFTLTATIGVDSGSQTVATFTDPAGAEALADYSATINWGDAATSSGAITYNSTSHVFTVTGDHTYTALGSDPITVTIHHDSATDAVAASSATVVSGHTSTNISAPGIVYGADGMVTVTVTSAVTPTGNVALVVDGGSAVTQSLMNGATTFIVTGLRAGNHSLTASYEPDTGFDPSSATGTLIVSQRPLTVTATGVDKVYDGTTTATVTLSDDRISGDAVTESYAASFADKNVGTAKSVSVSGISITGADAANYVLQNTTASTTANITARPLTVTATGVDKVYDRTTTATVMLSDDRISGDAVTESYASASFADKNVGTAKPVSVSGISITGADASNYALQNTTASTTANITARPLAVTATGVDRVYDGSTVATVTLSDNKLPGDAVTDVYASASFADKNVGTAKPVSVSGISITGADAGNYALQNTTTSTTANISARPLTVSASGVNKVYDSTIMATVTLSDGRISGDAIGDSYASASFADKNVGTAKPVSVSGISITGADASNYALQNTTASTTANITARPLAVTATGVDRVYDGSTVATVALSDNKLPGDAVTDAYASASFADKNVGTGKAVSVTGISVTGADAGNYALQNTTASTTANITARPLTVTVTGVNRVYDGTTTATVTLSDDRISGDAVTDNYTGASFAAKNVGTAKPVSVTGISISGADAGNYALQNTTASTTANITARPLTVTATGVNRVYDGTTTAAVTLSDDKISGDAVSDSYSSASFADKNVATAKPVSITGISITGADAGNYALQNTTASTTANITARPLTVTATGVNRAYNGTTTGTVTLSDNKISGDAVADNYTGAGFADKNVGTGKAVSVTGISITGADAGDYALQNTTASTTANITARPLTVTATGVNRVYDGTTTATVTLSDDKISGDAVTDNDTGASFADKNVGTAKPVSVTGISISGADAGNYALQNTTASTTANITARPLSVTATGVNKVYDATTLATVALADNRVSGDAVIDSYASASFADKNAGTGKPVGVNGISITGADSGNYALQNTTASTTASITPRPMTVTADNSSKVYGAANPAFTATYAGFISGDTSSLAGTLSFTTSATTFSPVGTYPVTPGGLTSTNYAITFVAGVLTIAKDSTITTGTASPSSIAIGQSVTLQATVTADAPSNGTPLSSVDFYDVTTSTDLGSKPLVGGSASLTTGQLGLGGQTILISYGGDGNFIGSSTTVSVTLTATPATPFIYVLDPSASGALSLVNSAGINVGGVVYVDSSSASAINAGGTSSITASAIDVVGSVQKGASVTFSVAPTTGVSPVADPLAGIVGPSTTGLTNYGAVSVSGNNSLTINPGIYTQISVGGKGSLTLNPGIYIIEGGGLTVTSNGSITGNGVLIFNASSNYPSTTNPGSFGGITLNTKGTISLSAPTSGPYTGLLIYQARNNTRALSLSGGLSGTIYAANALLSISGSGLVQGTAVVGTLSLSNSVSLTQLAQGSDGAGDSVGIANTLLAGNLQIYVNDPAGHFTPDMLARIQDAVNGWNALLVPYSVTVSQVSDPSLANVIIDDGTTSASGSAANGVLGCYNQATGEITIILGWNWYAGADPGQVSAGQYDFQTTIEHELGHALGLGGSTSPTSPMNETLPDGTARRAMTVADLNIPYPPEGADPITAAGYGEAERSSLVATVPSTEAFLPFGQTSAGAAVTMKSAQSPATTGANPFVLTLDRAFGQLPGMLTDVKTSTDAWRAGTIVVGPLGADGGVFTDGFADPQNWLESPASPAEAQPFKPQSSPSDSVKSGAAGKEARSGVAAEQSSIASDAVRSGWTLNPDAVDAIFSGGCDDGALRRPLAEVAVDGEPVALALLGLYFGMEAGEAEKQENGRKFQR